MPDSVNLSFSVSRQSTELKSNKAYILNFTAISLFMVISSITGAGTGVNATVLPKPENSVTESIVVRKIENKEVENMMSTEQYVRQYFSDIPIMIQVARCESHFRQ